MTRLEDIVPPLCIEKFNDKQELRCYHCKGTRQYAYLIKCPNWKAYNINGYKLKGGKKK